MLPRELRQYSNRKVFIALGAIIGLAFITTAAAAGALSILLIYRQGAQNYNDSRVQLAELITSVEVASRLTREYALIPDQAKLEAYRQLVAQNDERLDKIEAFAAPVSFAPSLTTLRPLIKQLEAEQNRILALIQVSNQAGAIAAMNEGTEQNLINQVTTQAEGIKAADVKQLGIDRARITSLAVAARNISLISLGFTLLLAILVYYLYLKAIQSERRLDKAKDEFVSLASHQLRSPATGVKSILATLVSGDVGPLSERQQYFATKALNSNERGLQVIEELLNVAKADAGRLVLNPTQFDLAELLRSIVSEQEVAIAQAGLELAVKLPDGSTTISADHDKLYMAIGNLIDNAKKYTSEGGEIIVRLANRPREVRIWVSDTGEGISKDDLPHIFDRFGRGTTDASQNVSGAGLGLYLVRAVVELHNGKISANSRRGKGTTFAMMIPKRKHHAT